MVVMLIFWGLVVAGLAAGVLVRGATAQRESAQFGPLFGEAGQRARQETGERIRRLR